MEIGIAIVGTLVALAVVIYSVDTAIVLYRRPDMHLWPSVTRCTICKKRIWTWQRYERRAMGVKVANPSRLYIVSVRVSASALYHCACKGETECQIREITEVEYERAKAVASKLQD